MNELVATDMKEVYKVNGLESKAIISEELIKSIRTPEFYSKSQMMKTPLWVASISHHLSTMDSYNGIKFDFVTSGNLNGVRNSAQQIMTNFLLSISETLLDANNVKSVSAQLINSEHGLVVRVVATPVISTRPVLDVISISTICKIFSSTNSFRITIKNIPGGVLKLVMIKVK